MSFNLQTLELDIFSEASHGKLKYDFRKVFDYDTGHALKLVYSLDNIKIQNINTIHSRIDNKPTDEEKQRNISDVQRNISKKGNNDHLSSGQKLLAIVDRVTGERLQSARTVGPFAPSVPNGYLDISGEINTLHHYYNSKGEEFINKYVKTIKVGDIEDFSTYKATHWFNNDKAVDTYTVDGHEYEDLLDNTIKRGNSVENMKYGRGVKLNDLEGSIITTDEPKYLHPSKRDINRNPELYRKHLSDEEFEQLMKRKTAREVKEDIDSVKEQINELNREETSSRESEHKKKTLLSILKENLKKLINWLKKIARSVGIIESVIEESSDDELYEYIEKEIDDMEFMESTMGKVKDGYLCDLPEEIQRKVMEAHKIVVAEVNSLIKEDKYEDLHESRWAMSCIDDFCIKPSPKDQVGSFRIFQKKKTYDCMIQLTGHFRNHQYGWIEDLLNSFMKDLFFRVRPIIRKRLDMTLKNEGSMGNPEEGFDIYPSKKIAEELWDKFDDRKSKPLKESSNDELFEERSHGKLKNSFRLAINKDNGHIIKIVFDLNPNDITRVGSHDDTNPIDENEQEKIARNIAKTGHTDFASVGKVLAIIDMDTNEKLNFVKTVGIMNGNHEWAEKPLKERENDIKNGAEFHGIKEFTVGEVEGNGKRFYQGSYKTTKAPKNAHDLRNVVNGHRNGRGYVKESEELTEGIFDIFKTKKKFEGGRVAFSNLPEGLRNLCKDTTIDIKKTFILSATELGFMEKAYSIQSGSYETKYNMNYFADIISGKQDDSFINIAFVSNDLECTYITVSSPIDSYFDSVTDEIRVDIGSVIKSTYNKLCESFSSSNPGKSLILDTFYSDDRTNNDEDLCFKIKCDEEYTKKLVNFINDPKNYPLNESTDPESNPDYNKEYNTEMTESQAKRTLRTLSQGIINKYDDTPGKGNNKVTQYTANIYANIITKNLLPKWAPSYKKFSITLDTYQSFNTVEFKIPIMSQDFISRFIEGKEPLGAFLHRVPEIKIKMSPRVFHSMETPDDAYNFFKSAIQYYDSKVEKYANKLMYEMFRLNHNMKHLISTTKLSSIVTIPLRLLFVFEDVAMNNKDTFTISKEDISSVNQFVRNIYTSYAAPEKEKKKIVEDMKNVVKELREKCEIDDNFKLSLYLSESVESFLFGKYDKEYNNIDQSWIKENVDVTGMKEADLTTSALYEKFGVKKLKKIPSDLIAYITIEAESIKDANDKMMIASYCCGKIEIVEWYIELLEVGSKKYVVPHTKPYLENIRTQLLQCYKKIMDTPIPKADRSIISVQYPKGYEG